MAEHTEVVFPKRPNLAVIVRMWIANGLGALATILFMLYIAPVPQGETPIYQVSRQDLAQVFIGIVVLLVVAILLMHLNTRNFSQWYAQLKNGLPPEKLPEAARRDVLNYPLRVSMISLIVWILAGLLFGLGISRSLLSFISNTLVGGGFSAVLSYFVTELYWRRIIVIFFPGGNLHATRAFRLSVFARLLVVFLLISLYPVTLLVVLSLGRAQEIVGATNPEIILQNLFLVEIFLLVISVAASVGMAFFVNRTIGGPLVKLERAMARVEAGDLQIKAPVLSNDEIGYLSERFNAMVQGLRHAERLRSLLNLYLSPQVARQAFEQGVSLGGQVVECTVLFSDIRGFTALSEQLLPEQLIRLLNRYMSAMVDVIVSGGGMVNKFGGDSLLAVFGTPLNPNPEHAQAALRAAIGMRRALERFNENQRQAGQPEIKIGIGIASGPVVVGNIGGELRIEYTVVGDTVNLASRLQTMTKEVGVDLLVGEETFTQAERLEDLRFEALSPLAVRGKQAPVKVYTLQE